MALYRASCGGKINLYLRVERETPSGFHDIVTVFLPFGFPADTLELDDAAPPGITLSADHPDIPVDGRNLIVRAAQAYAEAAKIAPTWAFDLTKKLPVSGGVGGGSANAGHTLRMLNDIYHRLSPEKLADIAVNLGADVPFFLGGEAALATGRGEKLTSLGKVPMPPLLLIYPRFPVSANWAYNHVEAFRKRPADPAEAAALVSALRERDYPALAQLMHNDLEYALWEKFPLLVKLREKLAALGALRVIVSGSGSSLAALFADDAAVIAAEAAMRDPALSVWRLAEEQK